MKYIIFIKITYKQLVRGNEISLNTLNHTQPYFIPFLIIVGTIIFVYKTNFSFINEYLI